MQGFPIREQQGSRTPLCDLVSVLEHPAHDQTWRCIAPSCTTVHQGNAAFDRVLKHAVTCKSLQAFNADLWQEALDQSGQGSLGATVEDNAAAPRATEQSAPQRKKIKGQSNLDIGQFRDAGKKAREEEQKIFQAKADHAVMRLICARGLVPHILDSPEWKELMAILNPRYHPTSADAFADNHIPREAVYVRQKQIAMLQQMNNLTLTFDGTSTRKPHSIHTVHAMTPCHQTYFLDAHEGSDERHTTQWVTDKLSKVRYKTFELILC